MKKAKFTSKISSRDKRRLPYAATACRTQDQNGPRDREHQQNELHVRDIMPEHAEAEIRRHSINSAIRRRERAARIDRVRNQRRRHARQKCNAEHCALQECLNLRQHQKRNEEKQEISGREKQIGQSEIDGKADQEADERRQKQVDAAAAPQRRAWR